MTLNLKNKFQKHFLTMSGLESKPLEKGTARSSLPTYSQEYNVVKTTSKHNVKRLM
jgi:hypothetical protein